MEKIFKVNANKDIKDIKGMDIHDFTQDMSPTLATPLPHPQKSNNWLHPP